MNASDLLIADSSEEFALALAQELQGRHHVRCCHDGKEAISLLRQTRPDILVLDLMLPELDGISLLQEASLEGLCPKVVAITSLVSDYVMETVQSLGIGYIIRKPCDVHAAAMRVQDLTRPVSAQADIPDLYGCCTELLLALGLFPKHRGYHYLRQAVVLMSQDPGQSVTKELYPAVATACHTLQWEHVERSIRSALSSAWARRDKADWDRYFPGQMTRCPSNAVFISRLAEELRNKKLRNISKMNSYPSA